MTSSFSKVLLVIVIFLLLPMYARAADITGYVQVESNGLDDTEAIQDALNSVMSSNKLIEGGTVYLPSEKYYISEPLVIDSSISIKGAGIGKTKIVVKDGVSMDAMIITNQFDKFREEDGGKPKWSDTNQVPQNFSVSNLTLDGNSNSKNGISAYAYDFLLRDLKIINCNQNGILVDWGTGPDTWNNNDSKFFESFLENIQISNCSIGINWNKLTDSFLKNIKISDCHTGIIANANIYFQNIDISDCSEVGIEANNQSFLNDISIKKSAIGLKLNGWHIDINGCIFKDNTSSDILVSEGSRYATIEDVTSEYQSKTSQSIVINGSNTILSNVKIKNNSSNVVNYSALKINANDFLGKTILLYNMNSTSVPEIDFANGLDKIEVHAASTNGNNNLYNEDNNYTLKTDVKSSYLINQKLDVATWINTNLNTINQLFKNDEIISTYIGNMDTIINVKSPEYNAKGDRATNDSQAIKKAINDLKPTGGTVYLPSGTYRITSPIILPSNVTLLGDGERATKIFLGDNSNSEMLVTDINSKNFGIKNISFYGNKYDDHNTSDVGISIDGSSFNVENVWVNGVSGDGIHINSRDTDSTYSTIKNLNIKYAAKKGAVFSGSSHVYTDMLTISESESVGLEINNKGQFGFVHLYANYTNPDIYDNNNAYQFVDNSGAKIRTLISETSGGNDSTAKAVLFNGKSSIVENLQIYNNKDTDIVVADDATNTHISLVQCKSPNNADSVVANMSNIDIHLMTVDGSLKNYSNNDSVSESGTIQGSLIVSGNSSWGNILTATPSCTNPNGGCSFDNYQWYLDGVEISGATKDKYTLLKDQIGKNITVSCLAHASDYYGVTFNSAESKVNKQDLLVTEVLYNGAYDGKAHNAKIAVTSSDWDGKTIVSGTSMDYGTTVTNIGEANSNYDLSPSYIDWTNGAKNVYYKISGGTYYNDVTGSTTVTISKKAVTVETEPTAKNPAYNNGSEVPLISVGSCSTGGTMQYKAENSNQTSYGTDIPTGTGITGTSYKVYYKCVASNTNYSDSTEASVMSTIASGILSGGSVSISGTNKWGQTLTANVTNTSPNATYTYQWYSNINNTTSGGALIDGATSNTYKIDKNLVDKYIYVVVTANKTNYETKTFNDITDTTSNGSATVEKQDLKVTEVLYSGVYDGEAHNAKIEVTSSDWDGKTIVSGTSTDYGTIVTNTGEANSNYDLSPSYTDWTNGSKTVYYKINGGTYYNDAKGSTTVTIGKKAVTVETEPTAKNPAYNNGSEVPLISVGSCSTGGTMQYKAENSNQTSYGTSIPTGTGIAGTSYKVYYKCVANNINYSDSAEANVTSIIIPKVIFKTNGGLGTDIIQPVQYNIPSELNKNTFTRTGYVFNGWNTKSDGTGVSYNDSQFVILTSDLTLYAQWADPYIIKKYTYIADKKYIDKIEVNTTPNVYKQNFELASGYSIDVDVKNIDGEEVLYTGGKTKIKCGESLIVEFTNIVSGDTNGDGKLNYLDYVNVYNHIKKVKHPGTNKKLLTNEFFAAAEMSGDTNINYLDYVKIYQKIKELKGGSN